MRWRARVTCRLSVPREFRSYRFGGGQGRLVNPTYEDYHGDVVETFVDPIVRQFYRWVVRADLGWPEYGSNGMRVGPKALRFWQWEA
jgi:hypothetical protein